MTLAFEKGTYVGDRAGSYEVSLATATQLLFVTGALSYCPSALGGPNPTGDTFLRYAGINDPTGQLEVRPDGLTFSVTGTGTAGLNYNTDYAYLSVTGCPSGSFTGDGSTGRTISLGESVGFVVMYRDPLSLAHSAIFLPAGEPGIAYVRDDVADASAAGVASLNAAGDTLTVSEEGTFGANTSGSGQYWVGLPTPTDSGTYVGDGSNPRTISLASSADLLLILSDTSAAWSIANADPALSGGMHYQNGDDRPSQGVTFDGSAFTLTTALNPLAPNESGVTYRYYAWSDSAAPPAPSGTASGTYGFTGTASGSRDSSGTASGIYGFTGTASGSRSSSGTASGAYGLEGSATGSRSSSGTGAGAYGFTGAASGTTPAVGGASGSASGSYGFTGTASGSRPSRGSALAGLFGFLGSAIGSRRSRGTAAGAYGFTGTASGPSLAPPGVPGVEPATPRGSLDTLTPVGDLEPATPSARLDAATPPGALAPATSVASLEPA